MKTRTTILISVMGFLLVVGVIVWNWENLLRVYIFHSVRAVTTRLPTCDRVEISRLDGDPFFNRAHAPTSGFPVKPYGEFAPILKVETLSDRDAEDFAILWRSQIYDPTLQSLCHSAAYGLRFYSGRKLLFETSLCFKCSRAVLVCT